MATSFPRLTTLPELEAYLGLKSEYGDRDLLLSILLGAEAFVERFCRRRFSPDPLLDENGNDTGMPVAKPFSIRNRTLVRIPDLRVATSVTLDGALLQPGYGYWLDQLGAEPITSIELDPTYLSYLIPSAPQVLTITGRWGFNPVPDDIQDAVKALAARRYREKDASWADSIAVPDGSVLSYFRQLPASVEAILRTYRTPLISFV